MTFQFVKWIFGIGSYTPLWKNTPHISSQNTPEEKHRRVETLSYDEQQIYNWLRAGYSSRWIAETLLKTQPAVNAIKQDVFGKLGVQNASQLVHFYGILEKSNSDIPMGEWQA